MMAAEAVMQELLVELQGLPEETLAEVLDFVGYLKAKRARQPEDEEDIRYAEEVLARYETHPEEFVAWEEAKAELEQTGP
ncbi:MAG: DUF2281 domain-containing protein [Anaerolineae bacterium]|nr:DUF2281 domain-containing protein [Anaerolineae bacterium]